MKLAFVTDTGTGFSQEYWAERGIYSVPLQITEGSTTYEENETITHDEVIQALHEKKVLKTSLPSLGKLEDLFEDLKKQGYEGVFCIPICRGLSGTLDAMESAARQNDLVFYGFDTSCTAVLQAESIVRAKRMYEEGKSIDEIMAVLEKMAASADTILLCDDLQHMKRGGRLTPLAAALGGMLKIKPVLYINKGTNGRVDVLDKVRTMSRAQSRVIDQMKKEGMNEHYDFTVAHVDAKEPAREYARKISAAFNNAPVRVVDLVSAVGIHTGLGCLAMQAFDPQGDHVDVYETALAPEEEIVRAE